MERNSLTRLPGLTEEQLATAAHWAAHHSVEELRERLAEPEPKGFGTEVPHGVLSRFRDEARGSFALAGRRWRLDLATALAEEQPEKIGALRRVVSESVWERLFDLLLDPNSGAGDVKTLHGLLTDTRSLDLQERKVALAERLAEGKGVRELAPEEHEARVRAFFGQIGE